MEFLRRSLPNTLPVIHRKALADQSYSCDRYVSVLVRLILSVHYNAVPNPLPECYEAIQLLHQDVLFAMCQGCTLEFSTRYIREQMP